MNKSTGGLIIQKKGISLQAIKYGLFKKRIQLNALLEPKSFVFCQQLKEK
jgi:hypothetical protein